MNGFWKRRLPAVLLALTLVVSLLPAALAADHTHQYNTSTWQRDNDNHWHACTVSGCTTRSDFEAHRLGGIVVDREPTCYQAGSGHRVCEVCGYSRSESLAATNRHTAASIWRYDENKHWHPCATSGCPARLSESSHSFPTGIYTSDASFHWQTCSVCGGGSGKLRHVDRNSDGICDVCQRGGISDGSGGGHSVSGTTITYEVAPGQDIPFQRADFLKVYREAFGSDSSFRYVTFDTSDPISTSNGTVYANYGHRNETYFTQRNLEDYRFYDQSSHDGDYALGSLSFVAPRDASPRTFTLNFCAWNSYSDRVEGTVKIRVTGAANSTLSYRVDPGDSVSFDVRDFTRCFQQVYDGYELRYVTFDTKDNLSTDAGTIYSHYGRSDQFSFTQKDLDSYRFYVSNPDYGDVALDSLSFVVPRNAEKRTVELNFEACYSSRRFVSGVLRIEIGGRGQETGEKLEVKVAPGGSVDLDRSSFYNYFRNIYGSSYDLRYVTFHPDRTLEGADGSFYADYGGKNEHHFTRTSLGNHIFYYKDSSYGEFSLDSLSFVAGKNFTAPLEVPFTAYYSNSRWVDGVLRIVPKTAPSTNTADLLYTTSYGTSVQFNPNDFVHYLQERYPGQSLSHVELLGVPSTGSLYYDYYGVSKYGTSHKLKLSSGNCGDQVYYFSPTSTSQYALSELSYVPSGMNYCATVPFVVHSTKGQSVAGNLLISVTYQTISEVYGATPKGTSVTFPGKALSTVVANATGSTLHSIQLLELPDASSGTVYAGSDRAMRGLKYTLSKDGTNLGQLRFVPNAGFTGSVEIPYLAYASNGTAIGSGRFCLGVVNGLKKFKDLPSSAWCYKYVTELSDAKVIDGYPDGTFRPDSVVTYGQALKLILLAAGYPAQAPTDPDSIFSGYLAKAQAEGILTGTVDVNQPISRLAVAQIAAKAMKLSTENLSSVKPFTDTSDPYVQALNAAGIVQGYFENGTSRYQPNNTLTRGQVSAIVWRMLRAQ